MLIGVTGGSGFIGSSLLSRLAARPHDTVRVLVRNATTTFDALGPNVEVCRGDLLSPIDCQRFADGLSAIYYLAHRNTPATSDIDLPNDALLNGVPLLNLLQAIRAGGSRPHVIYFSSGGAIYAPRHGGPPFVETDPCRPASSYGIQKLLGEHYLRMAAERGYLTATALRVGNAYGTLLPADRLQGLIGVAVNRAWCGMPVTVFGNPANVRDYVHLDDISAIAELVLTHDEPFSVFNVGTNTGHSVAEVLDVIERCIGIPVQRDLGGMGEIGAWLPEWCVLDVGRARSVFGWKPTLGLEQGVARMLEEAARAPWRAAVQPAV